jgi:hypothetical protein
MDLRECVRLAVVAAAGAAPVVRARVFLSGLPSEHDPLVEGLSSSVLAAVPTTKPVHVGSDVVFASTKQKQDIFQSNLLSQSMTASSVLENSKQTLTSVTELSRSTAQSVQNIVEANKQLDDQVQATLSKASESREATKAAIEFELRKLREAPSLHAQTLADTSSYSASTAQQSIIASDSVLASLSTI